MAISLQLPITLFAISRYAKDVDFNRFHAGHVKMSFLEPIPTVGMTLDDMPDLVNKCREKLEAEISRLS
jgi:1-acyl-sn-glycerol-3-phosphate acyltransferase